MVLFSSVFLPQIKVEITIQPQYQSIVQAQESDASNGETAHCVVIRNFDGVDIADDINEFYAKGYRLEGFSMASNAYTTGVIAGFAVVCKE